ncbi:MAG: nucleotidyl transferase AbiEii/AbiGii toxin family protein, partial [Raoultibacter sp.]
AGLPSSYGDVLVPCEMLEEICADKLKAFVCAENIRYRDLWDLRWIAAYPGFKKGMIPEILALKLKDYSATKLYADKLTGVLDSIDVIIASDAFMTQMKRFLPMSVVDQSIAIMS